MSFRRFAVPSSASLLLRVQSGVIPEPRHEELHNVYCYISCGKCQRGTEISCFTTYISHYKFFHGIDRHKVLFSKGPLYPMCHTNGNLSKAYPQKSILQKATHNTNPSCLLSCIYANPSRLIIDSHWLGDLHHTRDYFSMSGSIPITRNQ